MFFHKVVLKKEIQKWRHRKCYPSPHPSFQLRACTQLLVLLVCALSSHSQHLMDSVQDFKVLTRYKSKSLA
jgi:hypothetical protein